MLSFYFKEATMKKIFFILFLFLIFPAFVSPSTTKNNTTILPDLDKPDSIKVNEKQIYITEEARVYVYSRMDFTLIKKFGKSGDAPDTFKPYFKGRKKIFIDVHAEDILVTSNERISFFSKNGSFKKMMNIPPQTDEYCRVGEKLVASRHYFEGRNPKATEYIVLLKKEAQHYKPLKTIYSTKTGGGRQMRIIGNNKVDYNVIDNYFGFQVSENNIYIADTGKGFFISVYNQNGEQLYEIKKDYEKRKVTDKHKEIKTKEFRDGPNGKYEKYFNLVFPEHFPAFQEFWVSKGKIHVSTYIEKDNENEIHVFDLRGNKLQSAFVPTARYAAVYDNTYFFLKKNKDDEWELRSKKLKNE
jgi:hypothetical protein